MAASAAEQQHTTRYVDALVCKGFCNQIMALFDAAATAVMLNATLVLPNLYAGYNFFAAPSSPEHGLLYDAQANAAVPFSALLDEQHFAATLRPLLGVVHSLPLHLQAPAGGMGPHASRMAPLPLDPAHAQTLLPHRRWLANHEVLRLRCSIGSVTWSSQVRPA